MNKLASLIRTIGLTTQTIHLMRTGMAGLKPALKQAMAREEGIAQLVALGLSEYKATKALDETYEQMPYLNLIPDYGFAALTIATEIQLGEWSDE